MQELADFIQLPSYSITESPFVEWYRTSLKTEGRYQSYYGKGDLKEGLSPMKAGLYRYPPESLSSIPVSLNQQQEQSLKPQWVKARHDLYGYITDLQWQEYTMTPDSWVTIGQHTPTIVKNVVLEVRLDMMVERMEPPLNWPLAETFVDNNKPINMIIRQIEGERIGKVLNSEIDVSNLSVAYPEGIAQLTIQFQILDEVLPPIVDGKSIGLAHKMTIITYQ